MAPAAVHDGTAAAMTDKRIITLDAAFGAHPIRFKGVSPKPPVLLDKPTGKGAKAAAN
jgi:putative transposase